MATAAAAAAAAEKRAEDVFDVVCTRDVSVLRRLLKEKEGSAAASELVVEEIRRLLPR